MSRSSIIRAAYVACAVLLACGSSLTAQDCPPVMSGTSFAFVERDLNQKLGRIEQWDAQARHLLYLALAIGALGAIAAALQAVKPEKKPVAALLALPGVLVTVATIYSSNAYPADSKTLRRNAVEACRILREVTNEVAAFDAGSVTLPEQLVFQAQMLAKIAKIDDMAQAMYTATASVPLVAPLYAQSATLPIWVSTQPVDSFNLYFLGKGEAPSLTDATRKALADGRDKVAAQLAGQARIVGSSTVATRRINAVREYANSAAVEQRTFVTYDARSKLYRVSTLVKVNRTMARPELVQAIVDAAVAMPVPAPTTRRPLR